MIKKGVTLSTKLLTGDGRSMAVSDIAKHFKDLVSQATPSQGFIQRMSDDCYSLNVHFNTLDCDNVETIKTVKIYSLSKKTNLVKCVSDPIEVSNTLSAVSENGRYVARLKSRDNGSEKKQLLEVWDRSKLLKIINVTETPINTDEHFTSFRWSRLGDQDKLLYICQLKKHKALPFFGEKNEKESESIIGEEFTRREDWGEALDGIEHTVICILDAATGCERTYIDVPGFSLAQAQWLSSGRVVSIAHQEENRVGIIYCNNRPAKVLIHSISGDLLREISSQLECYHTVRPNNSGSKFIYLANPVYGSHQHASQFHLYDVEKDSSNNLVNENQRDFFVEGIPESCFTSDDKSFVFIQSDHLRHYMSLYDLSENKLMKIKFPTTGVSILDFKHDIILALGSDFNATPTLFVTHLNVNNLNDVVAWHQIEDCIHLNEIDYEAITMPTKDGSTFISGYLIKPNLDVLHEGLSDADKTGLLTQSNQIPTTVITHGGPNCSFYADYRVPWILRSRMGMNILLINYKGSTGVSEEYTDSLIGNIGKMDIEDCLHMTSALINDGKINPNKLVFEGGSHSGFIACHMTCQNDIKFACAIIRNPVVDIGSLLFTSDIPDWSACFSLGHKQYNPSWVPAPDELKKMDECGPIGKAAKANVPTLMLLGSKDRRVNMYQGEQWVNILRARGIETVCKVYADKHDLAKPETLINRLPYEIVWILDHLSKS